MFMTVDQIVVSVGPYKFVIVQPNSFNVFAKWVGRASPPISTFSPCSLSGYSATNACQSVGVACIIVTLSSSNSAVNAEGS